MNKSLSAYIKKYKLLSWRDCDQILEELSNISFEPHHFINYAGTYEPDDGDPLMYNSKDGQLSNEIYLTIMQSYFDCLLSYINDLNFPWYSNWNGYTAPKFNYYTKGMHMKNHCDHIDDIFTGDVKGVPVLSMIATLNDDFEGGKFIMCNDEDHTVSKGEVVIFPSSFLYPHKIEPLVTGTRVSMVSWVY